jgi:hypothetical protein
MKSLYGEQYYLIIPYAHIAHLVLESICVVTRTSVILKSHGRVHHTCRGHPAMELSNRCLTKYCLRGFPIDAVCLIHLQ